MSPTGSRLSVVEFQFSAAVIEWRGPAPFYYGDRTRPDVTRRNLG